jgi:replicative DNA helicase
LVEAKIKDQETKPDLVIIDYLAIMQVSSKEKKSWEAISQLTVELRALARKYDIPFMTAVQVNRDAVDKPKEFYEQQDIAMSFPIIQHSDIVISTKIPDRDVLLASPHCNMNAKFVKDRDGENRTFIITADFSTFRMEEPSIGHKFSSPGGEVRPAAPEAGKQ